MRVAGYYMFIETSSPHLPGDTAVLLTPMFAGTTQPRCLTFWYHMLGSDIGSLNVKVRTPIEVNSARPPYVSVASNQSEYYCFGTNHCVTIYTIDRYCRHIHLSPVPDLRGEFGQNLEMLAKLGKKLKWT